MLGLFRLSTAVIVIIIVTNKTSRTCCSWWRLVEELLCNPLQFERFKHSDQWIVIGVYESISTAVRALMFQSYGLRLDQDTFIYTLKVMQMGKELGPP